MPHMRPIVPPACNHTTPHHTTPHHTTPHHTTGDETMTTATATLASKHADSLITSIQACVDADAPFGHVNDMEEWHDVDDCPTDCEQVEASAYDYLSDALDIQYLVTFSREYRSARVMMSLGGPNVWIDTNSKRLEVHWGFDSEYRQLPSAFISALDEELEELWEMGA